MAQQTPEQPAEQPTLRLTVPRQTEAAELTLDAEQQAVVDLAQSPGHGSVLVLGGPGTGRSTVAVEYAAARIEAGLVPDRLLMLAPTRQAAARLRDALSVRLDRGGAGTRSSTPVRTWAAYAFDLIRRARVEGFLPQVERTPRLLSGAEQDTVIAELLETYAAGERPGPDWPEELDEAVQTRGFRQEVRELIDRTSEYGIEPGDLQELAARHGRAEWDAAAELLQDYRDRLDLGMAEAFDPAGLITTARQLLQDQPELAEQERERLSVLVIDDLQEATPAIHALLGVLGHGQDVVTTANPDTVVQGFRGARPDLLRQYPDALVLAQTLPGFEALAGSGGGQTITLTTGHRMAPDLVQAYQRVTRRIPADRRTAELRAGLIPVEPGEDSVPITGAAVHLVASPAHEDQLVLQQILELHHRHQVPLHRIAVMARSGPLVADLGRYLEAEGIPVDRTISDSVLKTEPAVAPLLGMLRMVTEAPAEDQPTLDIDAVLDLISGRYGRSTALHVRQLRQRLLAEERAAGGRRSSNELLLAALEDPALLEGIRVVGDGLARIGRMLRAGRTAAADPAATAETVLWALWAATDTPARWQDLAVTGTGHAARRADMDLDAVVGLFQAAERYVDQFPGAGPAAFADFMEAQNLPMDSLAAQSRHGESVSVLTPASAAGREWDVVIVAGLQDGIWPNTRLRGQLLGATDLAEIASGRATTSNHRTRVAEVRQDELRSFATALSRARVRVVGIGVASAELLPSDFLDLLAPWHPTPEQAEQGILSRPVTAVPTPLTASALVARLRRDLEETAHRLHRDPAQELTEADQQHVALAAAALARLAASGLPGAAPDHWWGLLPLSTEAPLTEPGGRIAVSPSRVQAALDNPLNWFMDQIGSQPVATAAQSIGTLVHAVAEAHPSGPLEALQAELERRLPELDLEPGWESDQALDRVRDMVAKLGMYLLTLPGTGRRIAGVEVPFAAEMDREDLHVTVRGIIDRLEIDAEGRPFVVDLKTGKSTPTVAEMERQAQLGAYQASIAAGGLDEALEKIADAGTLRAHEPGGAALVQLGATTAKVKVQEQDAVGPQDTWAQDLVFTAAERMVGPRFLAIHPPGRVFCRVPQVCPLCSQGRQTTEWSR